MGPRARQDTEARKPASPRTQDPALPPPRTPTTAPPRPGGKSMGGYRGTRVGEARPRPQPRDPRHSRTSALNPRLGSHMPLMQQHDSRATSHTHRRCNLLLCLREVAGAPQIRVHMHSRLRGSDMQRMRRKASQEMSSRSRPSPAEQHTGRARRRASDPHPAGTGQQH